MFGVSYQSGILWTTESIVVCVCVTVKTVLLYTEEKIYYKQVCYATKIMRKYLYITVSSIALLVYCVNSKVNGSLLSLLVMRYYCCEFYNQVSN